MTHIDTHDAHASAGHHEAPEVVDHRQRMAIWLFIGGDIITLAALLFIYLYLRGVNTGGHWMSMWGYQGHTYAQFENLLNSSAGLPHDTLIHVKPMSAGFNWFVTAVVVVSAAILWLGERTLRATKNAKAFSGTALLATAVAVLATVLSFMQLHKIPQIFVVHNDSQVMAFTSYSSAMMILIGAALIHYIILAFLGLGLSIRSARGVINGEKWYQARLVRIFWVWVALSSVIVSALTTTVNTIH
jgi:heme/copper-type cytochrome/quinol oxidase subunit 3